MDSRRVMRYAFSVPPTPKTVSRISLRDIERVLAALHPIPPGIEVCVSGWVHPEGWSRGFTVWRPPAPYVRPVHDGGRYVGRGWITRMVKDIRTAMETS